MAEITGEQTVGEFFKNIIREMQEADCEVMQLDFVVPSKDGSEISLGFDLVLTRCEPLED